MPEITPNPFYYVAPTDESKVHLNAIATDVNCLYETLLAEVADSAERTLAIRKLQEFRMWANCAVIMEQARA